MTIGVGWDLDDSGLMEANDATDGLVDTAGEAEGAVGDIGDTADDVGDQSSSAFDGFVDSIESGLGKLEEMKGRLLAVGAAASGTIFGFADMAGDIEESLNTINREFGSSANEITNWARQFSLATELTENETLRWTKTLGLNLRMLELNSDEMASVTQDIIEMSHNFSHFVDMEPEQAFNAIHQAIRGGRFPRALRDLTGQVRRTDIETRALTMGLIEQGGEMDQQSERIATISMLLDELAITQGAADAGQQEFNTRLARFGGLIRDIATNIGSLYRPAISRSLDVTNDFLASITDSGWVEFGGIVLGVTAGLASLAGIIGTGVFLFGKLSSVAAGLGTTAGLLIGKFALVAAAITLTILVVEDLWTGFQGGESAIFDLVSWIGETLGITEELRNAFNWLKIAGTTLWDDLKLTASGFMEYMDGFGDFIVGVLTFDTEKITEGWEKMFDGVGDIKEGLRSLFSDLGIIIWEGFWGLDSFLTKLAINLGIDLLENLTNSLLFGVETAWNSLVDWVEEKTGLELPKVEMPELNFREIAEEAWQQLLDWKDSLMKIEIPTIELPELNFDEWWEGIKGWFDDKFNIKSIIEDKFDFKLEAPGWLPDWMSWGGEDQSGEIEQEARSTQARTNNQTNNTTQNNDIQIKVEGSSNPEETAGVVRRELSTYMERQAGEVGQ